MSDYLPSFLQRKWLILVALTGAKRSANLQLRTRLPPPSRTGDGNVSRPEVISGKFTCWEVIICNNLNVASTSSPENENTFRVFFSVLVMHGALLVSGFVQWTIAH